MSKRTFRIGGPEPLLDVQSFGRGGPRERGDRLTPAQEIRAYATIIGGEIVARWCPITWRAFEDYRLGGVALSRLEVCPCPLTV